MIPPRPRYVDRRREHAAPDGERPAPAPGPDERATAPEERGRARDGEPDA